MNDRREEEKEWVERLASVLREPSDPQAEGRVMERVRAEPAIALPHRPGWRAGRWTAGLIAGWTAGWSCLVRPRAIVLRPIVPITAAFVTALLLLLLIHPPLAPVSIPDRPGPDHGALAGNVRPAQFACLAVGAHQVSVVGDFNDWQPGATPLVRTGNQGIWAGVLWLPPGVYKYALVVDGQLREADDARPAAPADEFGVSNSVLIVDRESI